MEPGYSVVVLLWTLQVGKGDRHCYRETHQNICPFPAFIHPHKENSLQITCKVGGIGILQKLGVGITRDTEHVETAYKCYAVPPEYTNPRRREKFTPASPTNFSDTNTTMTLTLKPLNLLDLTKTWYCEVQYKVRGDIFPLFRQKKPVTLPYPVDTTFAAYPPKPSYSREEVVNLRCRGYSAMSFSRTTKLKATFQRKQGSCWFNILANDTTQTEGIKADEQTLQGDFYHQLHILRLRVSSILGCSRRYRCLLSYKTFIFEEEAVELIINATTCVGKEPYIAECYPPGGTGNGTNGLDAGGSGAGGSGAGGSGATTASGLQNRTVSGQRRQEALLSLTSRDLLIAASVLAFLVLIICLLLFILARRRRKRKLKKISIRHTMPLPHDEIVVVGAGAPVSVHELSSFQPTRTSFSSNPSGTSFSSNPSQGHLAHSHSQQYSHDSQVSEISDYSSHTYHQ